MKKILNITATLEKAIEHFSQNVNFFNLENEEAKNYYLQKFQLKTYKVIEMRMSFHGTLRIDFIDESFGEMSSFSVKEVEKFYNPDVREFLSDSENIWNLQNYIFLFFYFFHESIKKVEIINSDLEIDEGELWDYDPDFLGLEIYKGDPKDYTIENFIAEEPKLSIYHFDKIRIRIKK